MLRWLLVLLLLNGLVPDVRDQVISLFEQARVSHVMRADKADGSTQQDPEHDCGPLDHHCLCCVGQPVIAQARGRSWLVQWQRTEGAQESPGSVRIGFSRRQLRPPVSA